MAVMSMQDVSCCLVFFSVGRRDYRHMFVMVPCALDWPAHEVVSKPMMLYAMEAAPEVAKAALEDAEQAVGEDGTSDVDPFEAELSEMLDSQKAGHCLSCACQT